MMAFVLFLGYKELQEQIKTAQNEKKKLQVLFHYISLI